MTDFAASTPLLQLPAEHVSVLHGPARTGCVAVATRAPGWSERAVPVAELPRYIETLPIGQNIYLSQARFRGWRRIAHLAHLNAAWVDLDYHKTSSCSAEEALHAVQRACDEGGLPLPSYVLGTGRGLALVWLVQVLPARALPRWQAVQAALITAFADLGADPVARDCARVLRLAGSLNTKPVPARVVRCLYPEVGVPHTYAFDDLCDALLPWSRPTRPTRSAEAPVAPGTQPTAPRPAPILRLVRGRSPAQLWTDRLADLQRLRELRWFGPLPAGHRDVWLFIAACAVAWIAPPSVVRRELRTLAQDALGGAWPPRLVDEMMGAAIRRAEDAGRGGTVTWQGVAIDPRYRFLTATILEWLEITLAEQRAMRTLIGPEESARRYAEHQAARRAQGGRVRGAQRREQASEADPAVARLLAQGLSQRVIAVELGMSRSAVQRSIARISAMDGGGWPAS